MFLKNCRAKFVIFLPLGVLGALGGKKKFNGQYSVFFILFVYKKILFCYDPIFYFRRSSCCALDTFWLLFF